MPDQVKRWIPGSLAGLAVVGLWAMGAWQPLERLAYNQLFRLRGGAAWDSRVVIVAIDDRSINQIGQFPWRRSHYANLIRRLTQAQASVVALHLPFNDTTPEDPILAQAMRQHQRVILCQDWDRSGHIRWPSLQLRQAAQLVTPIAIQEDDDGIARQVPWQVHQQPTLGVAALQTDAEVQHRSIALPSTDQAVWLNWSTLQQIPQYSFIQVLQGQVPPDAFQNKIVLVGPTATKMDETLTPFDRDPPANGVHLQATLVSNVLKQSLLQPVGSGWLVGAILAFVGLSRWLSGWRMRYQFLVMLGVMVVWCSAGVGLLFMAILLPIVPPVVLIGSTMVFRVVERYGAMKSVNRVLHHQSNHDELTQVANRRYGDRYLQAEWQRHLRDRAPLAVLMCDVDYFKLYNDTYGHPAGDYCLRQVARIMAETVKRPADLVARYGGEEFMLVLPNTPLMGAVRLAEDLRHNLKALKLPHAASLISDYVTVSIGVTSVVPARQLSPDRLVAAADAALYQAKQQGRDQVGIHWVTLSLPQVMKPFC